MASVTPALLLRRKRSDLNCYFFCARSTHLFLLLLWTVLVHVLKKDVECIMVYMHPLKDDHIVCSLVVYWRRDRSILGPAIFGPRENQGRAFLSLPNFARTSTNVSGCEQWSDTKSSN